MKQDEIDFFLGKRTNLPLKREKYLIKKWLRKGWIKSSLCFNSYTEKGRKVRSLIENLNLSDYDGQVVIVIFKIGPPAMGIITDYGDNGYYFYTKKIIKRKTCYSVDESEIAYVEKHPNPKRLWNKLNYLQWRIKGEEDFFHQKHTSFDETVYNRKGVIGQCYSECQCRNLGD